ncbi:HNH endonuclease [Desertihabitans brevis]|uniref:HNH endonuclease n=1 Tax=Desertihabitans brevis TaxID=2268447 RepID=A0A367YZT0_9ACTN|nr:HNH endonuclease signature motif containing protein [Desertihabitans brevis]RCK71009.1 HNH endonuclease [Desertihabitans brevis]
MEAARGIDATTVLAGARELHEQELSASAGLLRHAASWADLHPAVDADEAAVSTWQGRECGVPLAGEGTPQVDRACISEFAAAVGLPSESGQRLIGDALELRHRLPAVWALVQAGRVPAWRARGIAQSTSTLTLEAVAFVDRQVAAVAGRVGPRQLDRLVDAAVLEFMPEEAERRRLEAADRRHFTVRHPDDGDGGGLSYVEGTLDLVDALDLDAAISDGAVALAQAGCEQPLDVRRSMAVGELARRQPALDLGPTAEDDATTGPAVGSTTADQRGPGGSPAAGRSRVLLYLHLSADALGRTPTGAPDRAQVGWVGNTRTPVTAGQIRDWCGRPDAQVEVKPVIDLNENPSVEGYAIPDWLRERVTLRDRTCLFPFCHRPAHPRTLRAGRRGRALATPADEVPRKPTVQLDHQIPYEQGGPTSADNLVPLCPRHHNDKTHHRWRYRRLAPGVHLWTSPHGHRFLRDRDGTTALTGPPTGRRDGTRRSEQSPPPSAEPSPRTATGQTARPRGGAPPPAAPTPNGRSGAPPLRGAVATAPGERASGEHDPPPF